MQEGMRIKSKDITIFKSIFYLAINFIHWHFYYRLKLYLVKKLFPNRLVYLTAFKIERACKYPTGKLMTN